VKTWITSDLHFGHANIKKFCPETRGRFRDVEHMRETMISEWNQLVGQDDTVYMLGDVAFLPAVEAVAIMHRLHGRKILIEGNHDRKLLNDPAFRACFDQVHNYLRLTHNGQLVIMCHYPFHYEWDQAHRGSVHFFGHVHGKTTDLEQYRARDVGFDATGQVVVDMDLMIADAVKGKIPVHH
jgi:calcineurin-like phosphoesterase family protein